MKVLACILLVLTIGVGWIGFRPNLQAATYTTEQTSRIRAEPNAEDPHAPTVTTLCDNGLAGTYPCNKVDLLARMPLSSLGNGSSGSDVWGWTDPTTKKEYVLMGMQNGTAFVDISNPANPVYLGLLPSQKTGSVWQDIKVYNNYAFIVSESKDQGMQVFNLKQLPNVSNPPVTFSTTAHYSQITSSHNIFINEDSGYGYIVGAAGPQACGSGLHMVNLSSPASPVFAGCFSQDGYTHDVQCVNYSGPDTTYSGHEICFASNEDTLTIVDVTNKSTPVQLARIGYSGSRYAHQGWLTEDQNYFLMNDELDEINSGHNTRTYIWDVRDLDNPTMMAAHNGPTAASDHNLYVKDGLTYQANYRAGLRILDSTNVASGNLTEIAAFDTYPNNNASGTDGSWSVYPYFKSGTIVVSNYGAGLFILRHVHTKIYVPIIFR